MGRRALAAACALLPGLAAAANGSIRGEVRVGGKAERSGVAVWVGGYDEPSPDAHGEMHQCGKQFVPRTLFVQAGQWVDFVNDDGLTHNVYSPVDRLNMGRAPGHTRLPHRFRKLGVVDLHCDIHEEMQGALIVVPNRAHGVTGPSGAFRFTDIPPGPRTVSAWLPNGSTVAGRPSVADLLD